MIYGGTHQKRDDGKEKGKAKKMVRATEVGGNFSSSVNHRQLNTHSMQTNTAQKYPKVFKFP